MSAIDQTGLYLKQQAIGRYDRFSDTSIADLLSLSPTFHAVPDATIDFLLTNRAQVGRWLRQHTQTNAGKSVLNFFVTRTLSYLHQHNQFLIITPARQQKLRDVYFRFIDRYSQVIYYGQSGTELRHKLQGLLANHQQRLSWFVADVARDNGGLDFTLSEPVCSVYSPQFQLALLDLDHTDLMEPILDLGCGSGASLVQFLSGRGKTVVGIDRDVEPSNNLFRQDWFDLPFGVGNWGTIISHMAFSTHFLHHHLRQNGHPERYARLYMTILQSLKVGGRLIYTPGLPFIETLLPSDRYHVQKRLSQHPGVDVKIHGLKTTEINYTTIITRL